MVFGKYFMENMGFNAVALFRVSIKQNDFLVGMDKVKDAIAKFCSQLPYFPAHLFRVREREYSLSQDKPVNIRFDVDDFFV